MDLFSTDVLTGTINQLRPVTSHLLDMYFPIVQTETSEEIHFDLVKGDRRMAPFVSPVVGGKVMADRGFETKTFKPAYVKPKFAWNPNRPFKRMPGEPLTGQLTPMQRTQRMLAEDLLTQQGMVRRRLEWMAAQVLRTGSVTVTGDQYATTVVNFGRTGTLTKALTLTARWGEEGVDVLQNLKDWAGEVFAASGAYPRDVTMDQKGWNLFMSNTEVKERLKVLATAGVSPVSYAGADTHEAVFMGSLDGFNFYVYVGSYEDDDGTIKPFLPDYTVVMGSKGMQGAQAFGAVKDEEAGLQALPFFTKSWVEKDPGQRMILTQSAPLVVPQNVDGSCCITVR